MTESPRLTRRIQFLRATKSDDGFCTVDTFSPHGPTIGAEMKHISDGERWRASQVQANITTRFTVRWSSLTADINPKDRLIFEGREYNIFGVKEVDARRQWLEISAAARADT